MRSFGMLSLPQQLIYSKVVFMHNSLNHNDSPNYLAQVFISHQSHYTNSKNNLYLPRPRLHLLFFARASLWNSLRQNMKSCIFLSCFKHNLHKHMPENNLSPNLDGFVWITCLPKNSLIVVDMYVRERNIFPVFQQICRNSVKLR